MAGAFKRITAKSRTRHTAHKEYDIKLEVGSFAGDGLTGSGSFDGLNGSISGMVGEYEKRNLNGNMNQRVIF